MRLVNFVLATAATMVSAAPKPTDGSVCPKGKALMEFNMFDEGYNYEYSRGCGQNGPTAKVSGHFAVCEVDIGSPDMWGTDHCHTNIASANSSTLVLTNLQRPDCSLRLFTLNNCSDGYYAGEDNTVSSFDFYGRCVHQEIGISMSINPWQSWRVIC